MARAPPWAEREEEVGNMEQRTRRGPPGGWLPSVGIVTLMLASSCGGGGGGGGASGGSGSISTPAPALLSAVLVEGAAANGMPDPGESLVLFFDAAVTLAAGAVLDDEDVMLPPGASLGLGHAPAAVVEARSVAVTLVPGVALVPGTTTLDVAPGQDIILAMHGGPPATASTPRIITVGDGEAPAITSVTLNGIPALLNGTGPAGGTLQTPPSGFTIDVGYTDGPSGGAPLGLHVTADRPVFIGGTTVAAGQDLRPHMETLSSTAAGTSLRVPADMEFPPGSVDLSIVAFDASGLGSGVAMFRSRVATPSDARRPFETTSNPRQVWAVAFDRDLESISASGTASITITTDPGPNGRSDYEEVLRILGLQAANPIPGVHSGRDSNWVVRDLIVSEMLAALDDLFPEVNVEFVLEPPGGFPPATQVPYGSATHSRICVTGRSETGALGLALVDPNNAHQEDNCSHPGSSPAAASRLGVFLHAQLVTPNSGINGSVSSLFRATYDPFVPGRGAPIGVDPGDAVRLAAVVNGAAGDARQGDIEAAVDRIGRFLAVVVAHECGHSMGLTRNGTMPAGLYGGDPVHFPGSTDWHLRIPPSSGLYPGGAQPVMSSTISFHAAQHPETRFNPLCLAYLQEKVLCDGP